MAQLKPSTTEQIRESAKADLKHFYKMLKVAPKHHEEIREQRYNQTRECALSWGIFNLNEIEYFEREVFYEVLQK
jgi:delta 1-pyrroline-5-carboxylate dehydrogenase